MIIWIEVDLPPKALSPNAHRHWRTRHRASKIYKAQCVAKFRPIAAQLQPMTGAVTLHLEFYLGRGQATFERAARRDRFFPRDVDNARSSFKYGQDALVEAGFIAQDSVKYLQMGTTTLYTLAKDHGGRACVMVGLEYEPPTLP